ncbi:hypothetical protein [Gloeobacter kilaueensis]|uniref:Sensory transduction regulator n=1 Tax=Gloeobacter kilaueensis (strain ATCC BAA-2537 / CCAP 1431/1 / ULC 316 / JS1) TaxID=1183438 RepID=U5QIJ2_GLOK1|nr:hypothetical protein [Gloeobacter kilaueensis]AGY58751.1 hypothetical protein GKIL_2505 [Gloeobacter kilaueensis JS1]
MQFAEIAERLAVYSGWTVQANEKMVEVSVVLPNDRRQKVYIRPIGTLAVQGVASEMIEYYSAAVEIPKDQALSSLLAYSLLKTNAQMLIGAWGIDQRGESEFIAVFDTALLVTLDIEELAAAISVIAAEADRLEELWAGEDIW